MKITPFKPDDTNCSKRSHNGQCCCNCVYQWEIRGHPWVTGTSVVKKTGMYLCTALCETREPHTNKDAVRWGMASHKHGLCEMWVK